MMSDSIDSNNKLEEAQRNLEQLKAEEEGRKRRIALRREKEEARRLERERRRKQYFWVKPLLWISIIAVGFIWVAWNWDTLDKFIGQNLLN